MEKRKIILIGECGHNWNGDLNKARDLIWMVKDCQWDLVKFQLYHTPLIKKPSETNYDELLRSELSFDDAIILKEEANRAGIEIFFSAFDPERVFWCEMLHINRYKIASRSVRDTDLVNLILSKKKHTIISLGEWEHDYMPQLEGNIDYLFCVSRRKILREGLPKMPEKFYKEGYSGFSDHCIGNEFAFEAIRRGATIIEKHITGSKNWAGWDQPSSCDLLDMKIIYQFKLDWENKNETR